MGYHCGTVYQFSDLRGLSKASENVPDERGQLQTEHGAPEAGNGPGDFQPSDTAFHRGHYGCQQYPAGEVWRRLRLRRGYPAGGIRGHYEALSNRAEYCHRYRCGRTADCGV